MYKYFSETASSLRFFKISVIIHILLTQVLQTGVTHKEIPEEVQLEKDPTKRFSTFLQKPKPPTSPKPTGPYWHYPKAPKYLTKEADKDKEEPVRRKIKEKVKNNYIYENLTC